MTVVEEPTEGPETEDGEPAEDGDVTPVTEPSDGQDENADNEDPAGEEVDEMPSTDVPATDNSDDANDPVAAKTSNQPNEIVNTDETAEVFVKGVAVGEDSAKTPTSLTTAEVIFTNGCASDDGKTVRKDADLTFRVLPNNGYSVANVYCVVKETEEELVLTGASAASATGGIYTVPANTIKGKKVMIAVETAEIEYTLATAGTQAAQLKAVKADGDLAAIGVGDTKAVYSKANKIELALTGVTAGETYTVTAKASDASASVTTLTAGATKTAADVDKTEYIAYTLDATALNKVAKNAADTITVTVVKDTVETITADDATVDPSTGTGITVSAATVVTPNEYGYVAYKESGNYKAGEQVAFQINQTNDSIYAPITKADITAKLTHSTKAPIPLTVNDAPKSEDVKAGEVAGSTTAAYVVTLPKEVDEGYTLNIEVTAELDAAKSKTITFKQTGAPASAGTVATVETGAASNDLTPLPPTNRVRTTGDNLYVSIQSRESYLLTAVNVTVKGTIKDSAGKESPHEEKYVLDENEKKSKYPRYKVAANIPLKDTIAATTAEGSKVWTATSVEVEIVVADEIEGADEDKTVAFESVTANVGDNDEGAYKYEVKTVEDQVSFNNTTKEASIKEGTQYLEFSVEAAREPKVEVMPDGSTSDDNTKKLLEYLGEADGKHSYRVPAKAMRDEAKVVITREATSIKLANATMAGFANVSFDTTKEETLIGQKLTDATPVAVDVDAEIQVTVTPKTALPIASVTYKVGDGAETAVEADSTGSYAFTATASDAIEVSVTAGTDEKLFVNQVGKDDLQNEKIVPGEQVDVAYKGLITAWLTEADGTTKVDIINAAITENGKLAETKAEIDANVAKFEIAPTEYGKVLTVTLTKADRAKVSFEVVSDEAVSAVTYTKEDGTAVDGSVDLNADTELKLNVASELGNIKKVYVDVIDTPTAAAPTKVDAAVKDSEQQSDSNANITAEYDDGVLTITALPKTAAVEKAGTIVLWAEGSDDVLEGSVLNVSVNDPIVKGQTASIARVGSTGRSFTIKFNDLAAMKAEKLEKGALGFMVKMTLPATKPESIETTQWDAIAAKVAAYTDTNGKFVALSDLEADGHTIDLIPLSDLPAVIEGIKVVATPVQFLDKNDRDAADATKRVLGTASDELEAHTVAALYTNTLNLGKGASSLTTGMDADIVVATPVFSSEAKYVYVTPTIIDFSTGRPHTNAGNFIPKWNPADGTVTVNAKNAHYQTNAADGYKNLAIKITAFTESGDYGVSAVKKLSVINGIEDLKVTAQPEILKQGTKKVTAKTAVTYNTQYRSDLGTKCNPKKQAVTYEIVEAGAKIKGNVEIAKNGVITVAANYVPTGKKEDNQFKVKVTAADYAGNTVNATTPDYIVVTANEPALGRLAVVEKDGSVWKEVSGELQVKSTVDDQYKLVMFKDGVQKVSYTDLSSDTLNYKYYDIKSSNKSIVVDPANGNITVNKLGKTNFTMSPKSKAKPNRELKNVTFVSEKTDLYAHVVQYYDSTFETPKKEYYCSANSVITANDNTTNYFSVNFVKKVSDTGNNAVDYKTFALGDQNAVVSLKNAKKVTHSGTAGWTYFAATGGTDKKATVVKVNNKTVKPAKTIEITINNATVDALAKAGAPKIAMADKKQNLAADGVKKPVLMNVTPAKKGDKIESGTYIMLSADQTKKYKAIVNDVFDTYLDTPILLDHVNDALSTFEVGVTTTEPESYTLIAALGTMDNGVFVQTCKEAKITIKTTKANENIKVTNKYTLNPYGVAARKLEITSGYAAEIKSGTYNTAAVDQNFAENIIQKDGKANHFTDYFEVVGVNQIGTNTDGEPVYEYYQIRIKDTADLTKLADSKNIKEDLSGYITVDNGKKRVDVKLDITVKGQKDLKLKATAAEVVEGTNVVTDIQVLDGKEKVALESYTVTGTGFKQYYTQDLANNADEVTAENARKENGVIRVTAAAADKAEKVDLVVLPKGALANVIIKDGQPVYANGIEIKGVNIKVVKKITKNKVNVAAANKKWIVLPTNWKQTPEIVDGKEVYGWEKIDIPYSFKSGLSLEDHHKITVESSVDYVKFVSDDYDKDEDQKLTIFVDKAKLQAAIAADSKKVNWSKNVKVKATFSYDVAATDSTPAVVTGLAKDEVTFDITMPENVAYDAVDDLYAAVKASAESGALKKLAETKTNAYSGANIANRVANDLTTAIQKMAKGTSTTVTVEGNGESDPTYTYTIRVGKESSINIYVKKGMTARDVADYIEAHYAASDTTDASTNGDEADILKLSYYPTFTTEAQLVAALNGALPLPNNITLTATLTKTEQPKKNAVGLYEADILVQDNSVEPAVTGSKANASLVYVFDKLGDATDTNGLLDIGGTKGLETKLNVGDPTELEKLFSKAQSLTGADAIDKENVLSDAMTEKLIGLIEEYAKTLLADNSYIDVEGIEDFTCEWNGTTAWNVSFKINYVDNTPGAAEKNVQLVTANALIVTEAKLPSQFGPAELKAAAADEFATLKNIIGYAATEEAAVETITNIIKSVNVNPNYDPAKSLKVEANKFVAPTETASGLIDVTVCYNADREEGAASVGDTYSFTIAKEADTDKNTGEVKDSADINSPRTLWKERVQANLTADDINEIVREEYEKYGADTLKTKVVDAIKNTVTGILSGTTIAVADNEPVAVDSIEIPLSSVGTGTIKGIVIKLKDGGDASEWTDNTITIDQVQLVGDEVYQSEEEYFAALIAKLADPGLGYDANFAPAWKAISADLEGDALTAAEAARDDAIDAIEDAILAVAQNDSETVDLTGIATNPKWKATDYTGKITVTMPAANKDDDINYSATGVKGVTIVLEDADGEDRNIAALKNLDVTLRGQDDMPLIKTVDITTVGGTTLKNVADGKDGSTKTKAFEITAGTDLTTVEIGTVVTATANATDEYKALIWTAKDASGETEAALPTGITFADGTLKIAKNVAGDDVILHLNAKTAGAKIYDDGGEVVEDGNKQYYNTAEVFVKIILPETIEGIAFTVDDEEVADGTVYEAPAAPADPDAEANKKEITFTAIPSGAHVKADTEATITAPTNDPAIDGLTWAVDDNTIKLTITSDFAATTDVEQTIKLAAGTGEGKKEVEKKIKITSNANAAKGITVDFTGTDDVTWTKGGDDKNYGTEQAPIKSAGKMVVKDKKADADVLIPITVSDTARNWTTLAAEVVKKDDVHTLDATKLTKVVEKGQLYLQIDKAIGEIVEQRAADAANDVTKVDPCLVKVTLTSAAEGTKAAVSTSITFELVVEKTVTAIDIDNNDTENTKDDAGLITILDSSATNTLTLAATVKGTHLADKDQAVTWEIIGSTSTSKAVIATDKETGNGKITGISADDNIITVRATSVTDDNVTSTIRIKVMK